MSNLPSITYPENRLFTYKVRFDGGTAPNPFNKVCTLAICKPIIRRVATKGDIIAGFGIHGESNQLVYVMIVEERLCWKEYIKRCNSELQGKIPKSEKDFGDCIYEVDEFGNVAKVPRLDTRSRHNESSYSKDVERGKNVLLGKIFWYFGSGEKYKDSLRLPKELKEIVPYKQGHRSNANRNLAQEFIKWFNQIIIEKKLPCGVHGTPKLVINQNELPEETYIKCRC